MQNKSCKRKKNISGLDIKMELLRLAHNYLDWFELLDASLDKSGKAAYFSEMYEHCISLDQAFELLEETLTKSLLEVLSHLKSREIKPVAYAKHYIEKNKGVQIKLEELAKNAGFSYTYFSYLFKKETGKTLTEYIQMVRIEAAKKLLVEKERNVSEVAELVGYSDIKFFLPNSLKRRWASLPMNTAKCFWNAEKGRRSFEKKQWLKKTDSDLDKSHDFMELSCPDPVLSDSA